MEELQNLEISQYTQHKIQEAVDDAAFSDLLGNQISNREKACLLSLTLPQSGAWLSAPPIPSLGLHLQPNEFRAALKYRIGVPLYIEERKCPYCENGRLDKLGDHALSCHGRGIWHHGTIEWGIEYLLLARQQIYHPSANRKIWFQIITQGQETYTCPKGQRDNHLR